MTHPPSHSADPAAFSTIWPQRPVVLVFLPNTNELQRFVLAGAFDGLAADYELRYVLPAADADRMRAAAPVLDAAHTDEICVPTERFKRWQQVFQTACVHYRDLSASFAIRANLEPDTGRLQALTPEARAEYDREYERAVGSVLEGLEPLPEITELLDRYRPLLCIVPTSLLDLFCNDVVWACDAESVACLVLQSGWDNPSSKGILYKPSPFVGCWGPQSARHIREIQRVPKPFVRPLGAPHYQFLQSPRSVDVRRLRARLGVDKGEQLILFGGSFRQFDETSTLERLESAIADGRLGRTRIVYRPHPWRAARKHEESFFRREWSHVVFDPDMQDRYLREQDDPGYIKRNVPMFDMVYLSRLISASDAVISPMSTLLLESLILKKPTMAIAFGDGKHSHDPSVTSRMTHFADARSSGALLWCDSADRLVEDCAALLDPATADRQAKPRRYLLAQTVTQEPGTYAERLAEFCRGSIEPVARKMRARRADAKRLHISNAYGANRIARDYCGVRLRQPQVPGYWMHGWIPAFHNVHPALIALHKREGQGEGYDFEAQIRQEKEETPQWVSRADQAEYLIRHGYRKVKAIGLPITYIPVPDVERVAGSLLVLPPHSHKAHGPGDPVAEEYAEMIAALKPRFSHIAVGLHEDDIAKRQWVNAFRARGISVLPTTDQSDPETLVRLKRILSTFEFVTTNGFGSHIALAAYCGARTSVYGPYADFPYERMKATHAVKMFPELLDEAFYLCSEAALRRQYPFLFVEPDQAPVRQDWGAHEVGEPARLSPEELRTLFKWESEAEDDYPVAVGLRPSSVQGRGIIPAAPAPPAPVDRLHQHRALVRELRRASGRRRRPLVAFGMAHPGFYRNFEKVVAGLLAAGVDVHVRFSKQHDTISMDDYRVLSSEGGGRLGVSFQKTTQVRSPAERIRLVRDIIFYTRPQFARASDLVSRFGSLQKPGVLARPAQLLLRWFFLRTSQAFRDGVDARLETRELEVPPHKSAEKVMNGLEPDYVVVTPFVNFASREIDLVKAAAARGVPTLLAVASWDNLTNKGKMKVRPDHVAVWNAAMAREAHELHGVPPDRIWTTGAPVFDEWFGRAPSRDREAFMGMLGLDPAHRLVVYLCSSRSIAPSEQRVIKQWLSAIRLAERERMPVSVLIRPHPMETRSWVKELGTEAEGIARWRDGSVVWPIGTGHPTLPVGQADFFDTLYHADAVVGLNTSAMIEAAILGKPVMTFLGHGLRRSQTGNLHFRYLTDGGFLFVGKSLDQHVKQLWRVLNGAEPVADGCHRFVADFVRPFGREVAASDLLVEHILEAMVHAARLRAPQGEVAPTPALTGT